MVPILNRLFGCLIVGIYVLGISLPLSLLMLLDLLQECMGLNSGVGRGKHCYGRNVENYICEVGGGGGGAGTYIFRLLFKNLDFSLHYSKT